jgi:hypothetical protein
MIKNNINGLSKELVDRMKMSATASLSSAESLHKLHGNHKTEKLIEMYYDLLNHLKSM